MHSKDYHDDTQTGLESNKKYRYHSLYPGAAKRLENELREVKKAQQQLDEKYQQEKTELNEKEDELRRCLKVLEMH